MKKHIRVLSIILFAIISVKVLFAQPIKGKKFEFSTSASMWVIKDEYGEDEIVINLPIRLGYYVFKGLEIEPEIFYSIHDAEDDGFLILVNLSYNFTLAEKVIGFVLGGGGFGNSSQYFTVVNDEGIIISAINFGIGLKLLVGNSAAIRIEYRYTKYSGEVWRAIPMMYYRIDRKVSNIYVGISIFF